VDDYPGGGVCATASGACMLRAAIQEDNAVARGDTIVLPAGNYKIALAGADEYTAAAGDLDITDNPHLTGARSDTTTISANGKVNGDQVFHNQEAWRAV
jgi:hypothetical protein